MSEKELEEMLEEVFNVLDEAIEVADDSLTSIEKELNRLCGVMIAMTAVMTTMAFGPSAKEVVSDLAQAARKAFKGELTREEAREVMAKVTSGLDKLSEVIED